MSKKKEIQKQISKLQDELNEIELKERLKNNPPLIGKYYKYDNGYNLGERWWLYKKVTSIDEDGRLISFEFEKTSDDHIIIRASYDSWHDNGWIKISKKEFKKEWNKIKKEINTFEI